MTESRDLSPHVVRASRIVGLTVGQRLLLGLAPSLLAVVLVLVLAYYGEFGRQAPAYVVGGAALLSITSLAVTWHNTRYLAMRIRRLAGGVDSVRGDSDRGEEQYDEIGRIEQVVHRLGDALVTSEEERRRDAATSQSRLQQQAAMLGASVRDALGQLDEVRLPLHILVDARFGELNENQEELLIAARASADAMDVALRRLVLVADADRDAIPVLLERVSVNEVLRNVMPMLRAAVERRGGVVQLSLDPTLPRLQADRARLAESLALLGSECARAVGATVEAETETASAEPSALHVATFVTGRSVEVRFAPCASESGDRSLDSVVAERLVEAQGGRVERSGASLSVFLPFERRQPQPEAT